MPLPSSETMKKAICIIVQNPYEIDIRVRRKAEALVAAGYTVDAIALHSKHSPSKKYDVNGVTVHTVSLGKMRGSLFRYVFEYLAFFVAAFLKLAVLMRARRYSVIDVNTLPDFLVFAAAHAKLAGAKVVLDMHELTPEFFMSKYEVDRDHWLVKTSEFLERISFQYADRVITINEPVQELFVSRGLDPAKAIVMMNAADDALFEAGATGGNSRENDGKLVLMYHGTLTRIYGLDIAIEALSIAQREVPNAELWILGDGPEMASLKKHAEELGVAAKVRFIGRVLPTEISNWVKQSDIGVLATRRDVFLDFSFSNKLTEYVIMGKPVIASELRTIRHYFSPEALAYFEPNSAKSLAVQMVRVAQDVGLRHRLAEQARQEYVPIRWPVMKERYLNMIARLCGETARQTAPMSAEAACSPLPSAH
jgi:glycosyltransferase involved in cell wall biosynthesis